MQTPVSTTGDPSSWRLASPGAGVSIGQVSVGPGRSVESALREADRLLYGVKRDRAGTEERTVTGR